MRADLAFLFFFALTAGSMRKSTRARPAQSQARKAARAILRICLDSDFGELGGDDGDAGVGVVFGVVVVELGAGDDFADDGGFGGVVAEDGDFEFAGLGSGAAYALLDDELAVVAGGEVHRGGEFAAVVDFADAYGRA